MLYDLGYDKYNRFSDVFQGEVDQTVGWARETVNITATPGTVLEIGKLVVLNAALTTGTIPANQIALAAAAAGKIAIVAGKSLKCDLSTGFNPNVIVFTADTLTQAVTVVYRGQGGGSIGNANLIYPSDSTGSDKAAIETRLTVENGFKVLKQAVRS